MTQTQKATSKNSPKPAAAQKPPASKVDTAHYQEAETFIQPAGYWDAAQGPIHGKLVAAFEARQKSGRGKGKLRTTYILKLHEPCAARIRTESSNGTTGLEDGELEKGDLCAVFGSPGLRALNDLYGCNVLITRKPQKKVLKNGNEMWDFSVRFSGERRAVPVRRAFDSNSESLDEDSEVSSDPGDDPDLF